MALVISDQGVFARQEILRQTYQAQAFKLHLFQNNVVPDRNFSLTNFVEATFSGYAPVIITGWGLTVVTAHVGISQPTNIVFTRGAGATSNNVYGYYVTDNGNTVLYWSERDPAAPFNMAVVGTQYAVQLIDSYQNVAGVP